MTKFLPLFPLNLVAYPGQPLNLHIFEPRYRQMINDCMEEKATFGIPAYINSKLEFGTEVEILELSKVYADGRMDIKTVGLNVIAIKDFHAVWKDKLYPGGEVETLENVLEGDKHLSIKMVDLANELFSWLGEEKQAKVVADELSSTYALAAKVGLSPEQEYSLLLLLHEKERQYFLINHLEQIIPALQKAEIARERIKMNGHFRHLDPLNF